MWQNVIAAYTTAASADIWYISGVVDIAHDENESNSHTIEQPNRISGLIFSLMIPKKQNKITI